jgi:single-stranded DNA-binding protein
MTLIVEEGKGEQKFSLYVPIFVYGNGAEVAAEEVNAGDLIAVDGRLSWKSTLKKDGSKLGLCVSTFAVEILVKAAIPDEAVGDAELTPEPEPTSAPPPRKGKPHYSKWEPEPAGSVN